jgi:hypothetical protein
MDEHVADVVGVSCGEVLGMREEGDESPVRAQERNQARPVALSPAADHAHACGLRSIEIAHEYVPEAVRVADNQVRGIRVESDDAAVGAGGAPAAVGADRAAETVVVPLSSVAPNAQSRRVSRLEIANEDVRSEVRITGDEVRGRRLKRDEAAIGAHCTP